METGSESSPAFDYHEPPQSGLNSRAESEQSSPAPIRYFRYSNWSHLLKPQSWSLLSNPLSRSPADDLVFLERHFTSKIPLDPQGVPLVVLLVTPSRLELLNDEFTFIPKLFPLFFSNPYLGQLDVLVAVVDKIPFLTKPYLRIQDDGYQNHNGCEGISVLIGESKKVAPDLWDARDRVKERESHLTGARPPIVNNMNNMNHGNDHGATQQARALSFLFTPSAANRDSMAAHNLEGHFASYELKLPVANTLFQNGQMSTLYAECWEPSQSATGFSRVRKVLLPDQTLHVGGLLPDGSLNREFKLNTKLKPIVPPRIIAAAMGNIIRKFYTGSGSNPEATVPASKELEKAVSQYIKRSRDRTKKVDIWALVTPREYRVSGPRLRPNLQQSIENGSRLHKVLSGGGGWGIKEGLLALDPDCDYNCPEHEMQMGSGEDQIKDSAGAQVCRNLVKPGDLVSFLAPTPLNDRPSNLMEPRENLDSWKVKVLTTAIFGTLPSAMDSMPNSDSASGQPNMPFDHLLATNHFGMLSEHGMSIKIHNYGFEDSGNCGAEKVGVVVQTKLDAPYTRFSAIRLSGPTLVMERLPLRKGIVDPSSYTKDELDASSGMLGTMKDLAVSLGLSKPETPIAIAPPYFRLRKIATNKG